MKASELDALLVVARRHKVQAFEVGALKVSFSPLALAESPAEDAHQQAIAAAAARVRASKGDVPAGTPTRPEDDPELDPDSDLMWSAQ